MLGLAHASCRLTRVRDANSRSAKGWPGNRTKYSYDSLDRVTNGTGSSATLTWAYDGDGNRMSQGGATPGDVTSVLTYNNRGRLVAATTASGSMTMIYNALGQRVQKTSWLGVVEFVYDEAGHLLGEYDGNGDLLEETIWMGDLPVATLQANGSGGINVFYVHADHLSTPKTITRPTDNAIVWRWDQDPFGTAAPNANPSGLGAFSYNLRFPGQYFDAETGFNQNTNRDYDSAIGRYAQSDPSGLVGGVNTYAYAKMNPITRRDPLGLLDNPAEVAGLFPPPPPIQIVRGTPKNACTCQTSSGNPFSVPPGTNFGDVQSAGQAGGRFNPFAMGSAVGHFGAYDFQRSYVNNQFTGAYTDASNYAVGVYLQGAGYSLDQALAIASFFANSMSSNAGDPRQQAFWVEGWNDASNGLLACQ